MTSDHVLVRIVAPHFVCGVVLEGDTIVEAAPIVGYMLGRNGDWLRAYARRKGWRCTVAERWATTSK